MNQRRLILELQDTIMEKAIVKKAEGLAPLVQELKALQDSIRKGEEECRNIEKEIAAAEDKTKSLENLNEKMSEQAKASKERLYGAKGSSLKELLSLQQAIQKIEEEMEKNEAEYWNATKQIEQLKEKMQKLKTAVKELKLQYNERVKIYRAEKDKLELKLAEITIKEENLRGEIAPEVLKKFTETEKRYPLNPVAFLRGGICSGCHISVPSVLAIKIRDGKTLQRCDNCGRLLIIE